MNTITIVDTDILIDAARRSVRRLTVWMILSKVRIGISVITQMELFVGCRNKTELQNTERFLQRFQVLKLTEHISDTTLTCCTGIG